MSDPHADSRGMDPPAVGDQTLADDVVRGRVLAIGGGNPFKVLPDSDFHPAAAEVNHFAILHAIVLASLAEADGVSAHVPHGASVEDDVPGPDRRDRRVDVDVPLRKALPLLGQGPVGVGKGQAAQFDALDPMSPLGVAAEDHQLLQSRRDDGGVFRPLAGQRGIAEDAAGAIQSPLSRRKGRVGDVHRQKPAAVEERRIECRVPRGRGQRDNALPRIDRSDPQGRRAPDVKGLNFHVGSRPRRPNLIARVLEAVAPFALDRGRRRELLRDGIIALLGQVGAEPPLIVDEQLLKPPTPAANVRQRRSPLPLRIDFPAGDPLSAAEDRPLFAVGRIDRRRALRARVVGRELDGLREEVRAAADGDDHRPGPLRLGAAELADAMFCRVEGLQGSVRCVGAGLGQSTRPGVVALGGQIEVGRRHLRRRKRKNCPGHCRCQDADREGFHETLLAGLGGIAFGAGTRERGFLGRAAFYNAAGRRASKFPPPSKTMFHRGKAAYRSQPWDCMKSINQGGVQGFHVG